MELKYIGAPKVLYIHPMVAPPGPAAQHHEAIWSFNIGEVAPLVKECIVHEESFMWLPG